MRWINITTENDLPKVDGHYIVEDHNGYRRQTGYFEDDSFWLYSFKRWLDETPDHAEKMFTVKDLLDTWTNGYNNGYHDGYNTNNYEENHKKQFFKEQYNIDLP